MKEISEFCKSVKLGRFKKKEICKRLFATLTSSAFFWKLTVGQYFKSLANKNNSHESTVLHFFSMILKKREFWQTYIFFSFGLADDQKSFNKPWNNIFLHFCAVIMDFFIILKCYVFLFLITILQELPPRINSLGWKCTSNKIKLWKP